MNNAEMKKKLPVGIENFEKLRQLDYYYVDKTGLIKDLLLNMSEVTLFTRPRRLSQKVRQIPEHEYAAILLRDRYRSYLI